MGDDTHNDTKAFSNKFNVTGKNVSGINITGLKVVEVDGRLVVTVKTNSTAPLEVRVNGVITQLNAAGEFVADTSAVGTYTVTANVTENENWTSAFKNATFKVVKHNAVIESVVIDKPVVTLGDNETITVTMANVTSGKLIIEVGKHNYTVDIKDKAAVLKLNLSEGNYPVRVFYLGDAKYNETSDLSAGSFKVVAKNTTKITIVAPKFVVVDGVVFFNVTTNSTAPLTVKVNGQDATYMGAGKYNFTNASKVVFTPLLLQLLKTINIMQDTTPQHSLLLNTTLL
jgi:hypothetical protein